MDEIDINMSFLNCNYTRSIQLLAKYFLETIEISNQIDTMLAQALLSMSHYFITSYDIILKDQYEKKYFDLLKTMNENEAKEKIAKHRQRNIEELTISHIRFIDLIGGFHANV